jgi:aspartyl-tRNA(Asn)/glutamyl-tRNA(Gln) amidotransferase subunit A
MSRISDYQGGSARKNIETAIEKAKASSEYHALLSLTESRALERADAVDRGEITGRLAGVPFVVKDNFLAFGAPTTAASKMLENFDAPLQATAVERLEAEGAICIGKANLDAFAHGGSTENSAFGPTKNAVDATRVAGGSSGGSAVVTALDIVPFALGSDTGGSIRQPASFTDTIGCFATTSADAELVMDIMAGRDERDATTLPDFFAPQTDTLRSLKVGVIKEYMTDDVDEDVRASALAYIESLKTAGHTVEEVSLPIVEHALAMYYIIVPAEVSSNLARYDGIRYGYRAEGVKTLAELYGRSRDEGFVTENKRRIMIGSYVLSSGFFDAYYQQAQKARTLLIKGYDELFAQFDVLVGPTAPTPAFLLGENTDDPVKMYLTDIMTVPPSLAGIPALNVPAGTTKTGLPVGVQLIGAMKSDALLFALAKQIEEAHA